jgi:deazaflavin-dependent oxidoreductase (nitroreductase family)
MRLTVTGRRSGAERSVLLAYIEDGPNLATLAMNGWSPGEPLWWLNLQAHPVARAELPGEVRQVRGRAAEGSERERLWSLFGTLDKNLDGYAQLRARETAVVVLEPA